LAGWVGIGELAGKTALEETLRDCRVSSSDGNSWLSERGSGNPGDMGGLVGSATPHRGQNCFLQVLEMQRQPKLPGHLTVHIVPTNKRIPASEQTIGYHRIAMWRTAWGNEQPHVVFAGKRRGRRFSVQRSLPPSHPAGDSFEINCTIYACRTTEGNFVSPSDELGYNA
jgi:hypothetical protein